MVAENDQPSIPGRRLAERLRGLREQEHLTQKQLGRLLGGSDATVSLWENPASDRLPPPQRLAVYARLFCSRRSFDSDPPRLLSPDELTEEERTQETELYDELVKLRERTQSTNVPALAEGQRSALWHFADRIAVSIVCSDAVEPPPYSEPSHLNYSRYARYADLDALVTVFAQVKVDNPDRMVRILPTPRLALDFALNHLIVIGGAASDAASLFAQDLPLPVAEEIPGTDPVTHLFRCSVGEQTRTFKSVWDDGTLTQDVGLIARGPHPIVPGGTVTLLSGITSRGVHGAALSFIDSHLRDTNERYLEHAFGNAESFCILMNIPVQNDVALPPNLWRENTRLYEWSAETGARWGDVQDDN